MAEDKPKSQADIELEQEIRADRKFSNGRGES